MANNVTECVHCGLCTKNCLFLEKYKIDLKDLKERPDLAYHCFLCGTCKEVCPKGISGREIVLENRKELVAKAGGKLPDNSYDGLLLEISYFYHNNCYKELFILNLCN